MSDFFINVFDKTKRGGRVVGPAASNPSTGMHPASSAGRRPGKIAVALWVSLLTLLCGILGPGAGAEVALSHQDALRIGRKIWQNECGGTISGLTSWNAGEDFASLGIGHFIWYPAGRTGPFEESFPPLLGYLQKRGAKLPAALLPNDTDCPWNSRAQFLAAETSPKMKSLRKFLADTIDLQADFLVLRLREALPKMLAAAPTSERSAIERQFNRVAQSAQGCYALIDYVNFKGEGTLASERYRGQGWGLLQVLEGMSGSGVSDSATRGFADSAARVLKMRVANSPPGRHESRWLRGWLSRVASYRNF